MEEGFESGALTSASVFATCPWLSETAALARAHPDWSIGLHLTASSEWDQLRWAPVAPAGSVPTLVADDDIGDFLPRTRSPIERRDPNGRLPLPQLACRSGAALRACGVGLQV
jgi:hypothetical protein